MTQISFSHNEIWSIFIRTFTGEPSLKVTKVENNYITFKSNALDMSGLFKDPETIKSTVLHSYSLNVKAASYYDLNAQETIEQLVDSNFLQALQINLKSKICQDDTYTKVVTCNIQANSIFQLKQLTEGYKNLQSLLQNEEQISNIMLGNNKHLKEEDFTGEVSSYGEEIIDISSDAQNKTALVTIQYGKVLESAEKVNLKKPEVVSSKVEKEYVVDKNILLNYVQNVIPSGVIYFKTDSGSLQPILFQSMKSDKPNSFQSSVFDFILDVSSSMSNDLPKIKVKLNELITRIVDITDNCELKITPFSTSIFPTAKFYCNKYNTKDISNYINNLKTVSSTGLYNAMDKVYSDVEAEVSSDKNNVIFTITDGGDTEGGRSASDIIARSASLREKAPQSTMYNIGYSSYDKSFFDDLSKNNAAKTVHLDKVTDLEELYQDVNTINNCKVMYQFASNQYAQCAAGDIFIPPFTINENSVVKVAGDSYYIGLEEAISN